MVTSALDLSVSILIAGLGLFIINILGKKLGLSSGRVFCLYVWHSFFCVVYAYYVFQNGGDAIQYYSRSQISEYEFKLGTSATVFLTSIPAYYLELSFLATSLIFGLFGTIGLLAFDSALAETVRHKHRMVKIIASFVPFMPSISFWSAGIGKDSIAFFGVGLVVWGIQNLSNRLWVVIIGIIAMTLVRPHIAAFIMLSIGISVLFSRKMSFALKIFIAIVSMLAAYFVIPLVLQRIGLEDLSSANQVRQYLESRQDYNLDGGSSINIRDMSVPERLFSYLYRPFFFEAHNLTALMTSLENMVLLALSAFGFFALIRHKKLYASKNNIVFIMAYTTLCWFTLAQATANLGIATRQKWMFLPLILIFIFHHCKDNKKFKRFI